MRVGRLLFALCLGLASRAHAQAGKADAAGLQVFLAGAPEAKSRVRDEILEILGRAGLTTEFHDVASIDALHPWASSPQPQSVLGQAWLDLAASKSDRATIHLRDCVRQRVLVRALPLGNGWDEVASEEVVHIVATSLMALAQGVPLEAAQPTEDPPAQRNSPPPARTWMLPGLGLGAVHFADKPVLAQAIEGSFLLGRSWAALWSTLALTSTSRDSTSLHLRVREVSLAALPTWAFVRTSRVRAHLGLGPRIGLLVASPKVDPEASGVEADDTDLVWQGSLRAAIRVDLVLVGSLSTYLAATCDWAWPRYRYTVTGGPQEVAVIETLGFRPGLWLGLAFDLFGKEAS